MLELEAGCGYRITSEMGTVNFRGPTGFLAVRHKSNSVDFDRLIMVILSI